jgi:hypothetical protein
MIRCLPVLFFACLAVPAKAEDFDRPPINYSSSKPENIITQLQKRVDSGEVKLLFTDDHGYLPSVLKELKVPVSSQMLVFSKTSLQRDRISPRTPRALYFNDDVYIGFCRLGEVMEVSVADPTLGTIFYSLQQEPASKPKFQVRGIRGYRPTWCARSIPIAKASRSFRAGRFASITRVRSRIVGAVGM